MRWGRGSDPPNQDFGYYSRPRRRWRNIPATPWRWRYELVGALSTVESMQVIAHLRHPQFVIIPCGLAAALLLLPAVRHTAQRRLWCVVIPHRLRVGMIETGVLSWSGLLPGVLRSRPVRDGVEIWVWCPAGVDVRAFEAARAQLAAACWVAEVTPRRHPRWSHLVALLVITAPQRLRTYSDMI
jgi:hypothetical protein